VWWDPLINRFSAGCQYKNSDNQATFDEVHVRNIKKLAAYNFLEHPVSSKSTSHGKLHFYVIIKQLYAAPTTRK